METDDDREYFMVTLKINRRAQEMAKKISPEKVVEKVVERLSSNQREIVEAVIKNPAISAKALADLVGISPRKIQDNIAKLKGLGILKRVGPDKGGHWEVVEK